MAIQLKEFTTSAKKVRLQFVELLGLGVIDGEQQILNLSKKEYIDFLKKYEAQVDVIGELILYCWDEKDLKKARKFKNMLNKKAREGKFSKAKVISSKS